MFDMVALGEAMVRFTPTREFLSTIGGSELNSAAGMRQFGAQCGLGVQIG